MRISAWATGLAVAVFQVGATWLAAMGDRQPLRYPLDAFAVFLLLAGPLALMGRDRWPVAAVAVAVVSTDLYLAMGYPYGPVFLSVVVAVFSAIRRGRRYPTYAWVAAGVVALVAAYRLSPRVVETHGSLHFLFIVGWTGGSWPCRRSPGSRRCAPRSASGSKKRKRSARRPTSVSSSPRSSTTCSPTTYR